MKKAKPFLKWAGGKTQLLPEIEKRIPFSKDQSFNYIEPFVGAGAVLFHMLNNYPRARVVVNDINMDLVNTYNKIKINFYHVLDLLLRFEYKFHSLDIDSQKKYYYEKRDLFNNKFDFSPTYGAALFIFLNKTCFNGLYRVNKKGFFNVPVGSYKKPLICDSGNLKAASEALEDVQFYNGDFDQIPYLQNFSDYSNTFVYIDPPYKPLSETSSFNSYSNKPFDDSEQERLKSFCDSINELGGKFLLSNSDHPFFYDLYKDYKIEKVQAKRNINSKGSKRGNVNELLIKNY
jgi:DNA adenine methylase